MRYLIIDLETSVDNTTVGSHKASPWCMDNQIVLAGWKRVDLSMHVVGPVFVDTTAPTPLPRELVVGHNLKFDLHYLRTRCPEWRHWFAEGSVWCTQLAEYLLSGQVYKYPALDDTAVRYGGTRKPDIIKEYWASGMRTEDIPTDQLATYLEGDIRNTEIVYLAQRKRAIELGMESLLLANMNALMATCEMEYNGMAFDRDGALEEARTLAVERDRIRTWIERVMATYLPGLEPNASSRDHLSLVLFGGTYEVFEDLPIVDGGGFISCYKTGSRKGEVKTKKQAQPRKVVGRYRPDPTWVTKKDGIYQVNDAVLAKIPTDGLVQLVLEYRRLEKDLSTYYQGYSDLVWNDGCIHPSLEHCSTATGRLSCARPNLQNCSG